MADLPRDHRTFTGARRSDRTRRRLVEAAILVIARDGIGPALIEDVVRQAGVARGTFYNHFAGVPEVLIAADQTLADDVTGLIVKRILPVSDPVDALATGVSLFLTAARAYPLVARFSADVGVAKQGPLDTVKRVGEDLLAIGVATGQFTDLPPDLAIGFVSVMVALALKHQAEGNPIDIPVTVAAVLRLLGVSRAEADRMAQRPIVPLSVPADSLLARSHAALVGEHAPA